VVYYLSVLGGVMAKRFIKSLLTKSVERYTIHKSEYFNCHLKITYMYLYFSLSMSQLNYMLFVVNNFSDLGECVGWS